MYMFFYNYLVLVFGHFIGLKMSHVRHVSIILKQILSARTVCKCFNKIFYFVFMFSIIEYHSLKEVNLVDYNSIAMI